MKKSIYIIIIMLAFFSTDLLAQKGIKKIQTLEFTVHGVCGMCEQRIERAALMKGVKMAEWDKHAQKIRVVFRTSKTDQKTIEQAIAKVGHDTENFKAPDAVYNQLPACCAYRDGAEIH